MVIVDIDNDYEDSLVDSYQIIKNEEDDTYKVWVSTGMLTGYVSGPKLGFESFQEAWNHLIQTVEVF